MLLGGGNAPESPTTPLLSLAAFLRTIEAWVVHLFEELPEPGFFAKLESTIDPWKRSRMVGEKIWGMAKEYAGLSPDMKAELGKKAKIELRAGTKMPLIDKEKRGTTDLLEAMLSTIESSKIRSIDS